MNPRTQALQEKVSTGIPELDDLLEGGFIRNSTVLLRGGAGTGKTIFALQYLEYGAMNGEPGVLLSIEESKKDIFRESARFGWDFESLEKQKKVAVIERQTQYGLMMHQLQETIHEIGARRAVVDSVPALFSSYPNELQSSEFRSAFHLLGQILTELCDCTAILITETAWSAKRPYEEYVPKGVIEFNVKMMDGVSRKFLLIKKMREVHHSKRLHLYEITDKGFSIFIPRK